MKRRRRSGLSTFGIGLVSLIVITVGTYLGFTKSIPFVPHYEIKAAFKSANNLKKGSPVRIAGVEVGKVTAIERARPGDNGTLVTMQIKDNGLPLHQDATFKIRPRIFLEGNFFVDIQPGTPSAPLIKDGYTIPVNQTSAPVQLDQILTTLQSSTRKDLQKLLRELSTGFNGGGAAG